MIFQLIYLSKASIHFLPKDIDQILQTALARNSAQEITGMFLSKGGRFLQLLEGNKEVVNNLFQHISKDRRHEDVRLLLTTESPERVFKDWSMAHKNMDTLSDKELSALPLLNEFLKQGANTQIDNERIKKILIEFRFFRRSSVA